jgi:ATP-binding cassette, subfamily B, bacterial MsbA
MSSRELFRRLLGYSGGYWIGFLVAVIAMIITAATETAFPALMKPLLDNGFQSSGSFPIWWVPTAVLIIFVARGLSTFVSSYAMSWVSHNVLRDIRQQLFEKIISLPASSMDHKSAGTIISRVISDAQMVLEACTTVLTSLVRDSLVLIGLLGWLLWLNWKLTLIVILLVPALAFMTVQFSRRLRSVSRGYLDAVGGMTSSVEEAVTANRVIKAFDGQKHEAFRFSGVNDRFRGQAMRIAVASALQSPVSQFIAAIGVAIILTIALFQSRSGLNTVGDFVSFLTAMLMMFSPLKSLANVNAQIQRGLAAAENVFKLLDEPGEPKSGLELEQRLSGAVSFNRVSLTYRGRDQPALREISLDVRAGETVALVGRSGGGKSTLIHLIPRFYEIDAGQITLDGIDIREIRLSSLRSQIALVSQDIALFNDTIFNNIAYGRPEASEEVILAAAHTACLGQFIDELPLGLHTMIGDRGVRLSGGQRQRIAIARAILKDAPILLLDEATSALDNDSERMVQRAIENLRIGRTTLVVAHRLSTVVHADLIVVLEGGEIVQQGSHASLIEESGPYRALYREFESTT